MTAKKAAKPKSAAETLLARVRKDLNLEDDDLILGSQLKNREMKKTSTGILAVDVALNGGLPLNQWCEVVGHESSGKTALAMQIVAAQQEMNSEWTCLWVAAEGFEPSYAEMNGVDVDRVVVADINSMEEAFNIIVQMLEERAVDGVVIDSYPALVTTSEYEKTIGDMTVSPGARIMGTFFRKVQKASRRSMTSEDRPWIGIIINQWRDLIGGWSPAGTPKTTPGGKNKNYSYYTRLEVKRDAMLDNGLKGRDKQVVGQTIEVKVLKNKGGPSQKRAAFDFYVDNFEDFEAGDIDILKDVFLTAQALGVVEREKNTFYFMGEKLGGNSVATMETLENNPDVVEKIQSEVYLALKRKTGGALEEPEKPRKVVRHK